MPPPLLEQFTGRVRQQGSDVTLNSESLGSARLPALWKKSFDSEEINITGASLSEPEGSTVVRGAAPLFFNVENLPVEIIFFAATDAQSGDENLECLIRADLPATWSFGQSYPEMLSSKAASSAPAAPAARRSFFSELALSQLKLLFSSRDYHESPEAWPTSLTVDAFELPRPELIHQGLNFFGVLDLAGPLSALEPFIGGGNALPLHGYIEDDEGDTQAHLFADLPFELEPITLALSQIGIYSSLSAKSGNASGVELQASLAVEDMVLAITASYAIGGDSMVFEGRFENLALPGLGQLASLVGGSDLESQLPPSVSELGSLSIKQFALALSLSTKRVSYVMLDIAASDEWPVIPGDILTLKDLLLRWHISNPFEATRAVSLEINSILEIDDVGVYVCAELPDFQLSGGLTPGTTLELSTVLSRFLPGIEDMPELSILDLDFSAYPAQKTFQIYAVIADDWTLELGDTSLGLRSLVLDLTYADKSMVGSISGTAEIAGVEVTISASRPEPGASWSFNATIPELNLSALADQFMKGVALPDELPDLMFSDLGFSVTPSTGAFSVSGRCTAKWDLPFGVAGLAVSTVDIDLRRAPSVGADKQRVRGPISCSLDLTGAGLVPVADGLTFNSFNLSFDLVNQASWSLSGSMSANIFDVDYSLAASADYALATATQPAVLRKLSLSAAVLSATPLVSLPGIGSLDVDSFAIIISKSQPSTSTGASPSGASTDSATQSSVTGASPDSTTPSSASVTPPAPVASSTLADSPSSGVSPGQPPLSYTWDVSATGAIKIDGVFTLDGSLQLYKKNGTTGFAFKARDAHVEIPLPVPGHSIKTYLGLGYISVVRTTVSAAQSTWAFDAAIDVWFTGLPQTFQKIFADKIAGRFKADSNEVVVSITRVTDPVQFTVPDIQIGSASQPIGEMLFDASNFALRLGSTVQLSMDFGLGLPQSLNTIFGTNADGTPQMQFFNTYEPGKPETMTRFRLGVSSLAGVTVQTITSPVKAIRLVQERGASWLHANLGEFGEARCKVPVFSYAGGNFTASGAFFQVPGRPLMLPLTPLKLLLKACKLDAAADALPSGLPLAELSLVDDNNNFRAGEFIRTLERMMGGFTLPSEIRDALQLIESRFDALPERFKSYLKIEIPDAFMFDISVTAGGGARGRVWVEGGKPIKVIYPTMGPLGPRLTGIELYSLMFGQVLGGSLLIMNIDARVDQFDLVTLASALALPLDKLPILPDTRSFSQHFVIKDLFMIVIYQGVIPIPVPLFFGELGVEYLGIEGVTFQTHWGFPKPRLNMGEAAKIFSQFKQFFTDRDALLDAGSAPKDLTLQLIVGSNYIGLPKYLGSGTLGIRNALAPINAYENQAHLLNALKILSLNEVIQALPLDYRVGTERITFGPLELQASWLMTTPDEFRRVAYQRLSLQAADRETFLKILPAAAGAKVAAGAEQGLVVFLKGGAKIKDIIKLDCAFGLAASSTMGFDTGFKMKGSIAAFLDIELGGIVVINPRSSAPAAPGAKSAAQAQQPKDAVFRLEGNSQLTILGHRIFDGDIQIADGSSFRFKGKLQLFPDNSPLQISGNLEGSLAQNLFLTGDADTKLAGLPLQSAQAVISNEKVSISGIWLGQKATLDVKNMFNKLVLRGSIVVGFKVQADLGKITNGTVKLADNYSVNVVVTATLDVVVNAARLTLNVQANFLLKGKGESLSFTMTVAPADVDAIAEEVRKRIVAEPRKYFDKMFGDAGEWLKGQATGAFQWTGDQYKEAGKVLKTAYNLTNGQAIAALTEAGRDTEHIGRVLAQAYELSFGDTMGAMKSVGAKASDMVGALQRVFPPTPTKLGSFGGMPLFDKGERVVAGTLKRVGYSANDVAPVLKDVFSTKGSQAAWILKTAGYRAEDAASALKSVFKTSAEDIAKYMKAIYDKSDDAINQILKGAGYASKDVDDALKSVKKFAGKLNPFD